MKRYFAAGFLAALAVVLLMGAMIDYRALNSTQFGTNGLIVSLINGVVTTNQHETATNFASYVQVSNDVHAVGIIVSDDTISALGFDSVQYRGGGIKLTNAFQLLSGAGSGLVLTSDGSGNGTWAAVSTQNITNNTTITTNLFFINGKGNTLLITQQLVLNFVTNAVLVTKNQDVTNAVLSGLTYDGTTRTLAVASGLTSLGIPHYKFRRTTLLEPTGTGAGITILGDSATITGSGSTANVSTNAVAVSIGTGAGADLDGGIAGNGNYRIERNVAFFFRGSLQSNIQERAFIGMTTAGLGTAVNDDTGGGAVNYFAFQYSTPRGDTTWQVTTKDGGTQVVHDTLVTVTTNEFTLEMLYDVSVAASNITFYINGNLVDTRASTNMPAGGVNYAYVLGIETQDSQDKRLLVSGMEVSADK